jgi:hypothetical protein
MEDGQWDFNIRMPESGGIGNWELGIGNWELCTLQCLGTPRCNPVALAIVLQHANEPAAKELQCGAHLRAGSRAGSRAGNGG